MDFQEAYPKAAFGFLGISEVEFVRDQGVKTEALKQARAQIERQAA